MHALVVSIVQAVPESNWYNELESDGEETFTNAQNRILSNRDERPFSEYTFVMDFNSHSSSFPIIYSPPTPFQNVNLMLREISFKNILRCAYELTVSSSKENL